MKFLKLLVMVAAFGALGMVASAQGVLPVSPVQTFRTQLGDVTITPVYHASVRVEGGGKVIYIDPAKPADFSAMPKADLILITHEHGDHVDMDQTSIKVLSKAGTMIWAPAKVQSTIVSQATVMHNGDKKQFGDWTVEAVPAYNEKRGPAPGQFFHPKGNGNGYVLSYGGQRFYFSGDTEAVPELKALKNIDVAFVCINLPYTMTVDEAVELTKAIHPRVVIPYHYRGNPTTDLNDFAAKLKGSGVEVRLLEWYPSRAG